MQRFDHAHPQPAGPHPVAVPEELLRGMISALQHEDLDLAEFARQLNRYPAVTRRILQAANSASSGRWQKITDLAHAAAYLGSRRLIQLLISLPETALMETAPVEKTASAE